MKGGWLWRLVRRLFWLGFGAAALGLAAIGYMYVAPILASRGRLFSSVDKLPKTKVGLVFGTSDRVGGYENPFFRYRIDAAVRIWKAGKVDTFLVSGDNRTHYYNEPEKMRSALVARGVPASRIVCDYAGLRTLDSVVRAKEVFGATSIVFISQRFQNQRAIYLAEAHDMDVYGFNAQDVALKYDTKTRIREIGARVKMWLDVNVLHTRPRFLGEKIHLP